MRQKKQKPVSLEELLNPQKDKKALLQERYKRSLGDAYSDDANEAETANKYGLRTGNYSLRTRIKNNPWLKSGRPANKALSWLHQEVLRNPGTYRYKNRYMQAGSLFTFEYLNPKCKGTASLPWFDKYPLVLSLGPIVTKQGIRNIGFNLHLCPPKIRIIILCQIFELYKSLYRYNIFFKRTRPVTIKYNMVIKALKKYGADFCVRMYIPARQRAVVIFPYSDWYKAIFVPSRGYDSIKAQKLIQLWRQHVRKLKYTTQHNLDWTTHI